MKNSLKGSKERFDLEEGRRETYSPIFCKCLVQIIFFDTNTNIFASNVQFRRHASFNITLKTYFVGIIVINDGMFPLKQ